MQNAVIILDRSLTAARLAIELLKPLAGRVARARDTAEALEALDRICLEGAQQCMLLLSASAAEGDIVTTIETLRRKRPDLAVLVVMDSLDLGLASEVRDYCGALSDWVVRDTRYISVLPGRAKRLLERARKISEQMNALAETLSAPPGAGEDELRRRLELAAKTIEAIHSGGAHRGAAMIAADMLAPTGDPILRTYRRAFDSIPHGILACDGKGFIRFGNLAAAEMLGQPRQALSGAFFTDLIGPADREAVKNALDESAAGNPSDVVVTFTDELGDTRRILLTLRDLTESANGDDPDGGMVLVCLRPCVPPPEARDTINNLDRDVRRLNVLNRVVRRAQRITDLDGMLQKILSAIMDAVPWDGGAFFIAERGAESGVIRAKRGQVPPLDDPQVLAALRAAAERILDPSSESAPPTFISKFHEEPSSVLTVLVDSASAASGSIPGFESSLLIGLSSRDNPQGALCLFSRKPRQLTHEETEILHSICPQVAVAIENARLLRDVSNARAEWEGTFDAIPDPAFVIDETHTILNANRAFCEAVGMSRAKVIGRKCHEVVHGAAVPYVDCPALDSMRSGKTEAREIMEEHDGKTWWVTCSPLGTDTAGRRRYVHVARDVSELKRLHHDLAQAERMSSLGQLVSGIAHELNNPLAGILGYSQMLADKPGAAPFRQEIRQIETLADRCRMIVQNLISFSREKPPSLAPVDVACLLEEALEAFSARIEEVGISVRREIAADLPVVMADAQSLRLSFQNVIDNALQAMEGRKGVLAVRAMHEDACVAVEIQDTGPGIEESQISRIFEPFFTTREVGKGTGLGLSVVYGTVTALGGSVAARNAPEGGAIIRIELPAQFERAESRQAQPLTERSLRAKKILVIEDDEPIRDMVRCLLEAEGCDVTCASNGIMAMEAIATRAYDVVVSDIKMPGMSGARFYETLRQKRPEVLQRLIFMTGDPAAGDVERQALQDGIPVIEKPFDIDDFLDAVRRRAFQD